jgi:NitT/TauT family transport system substrate-binding protein
MFRKIFLLFSLSAIISSCNQPQDSVESEDTKTEASDSIRLALDWSPNVLHAPLFWAEMHGYFEEEGLVVEYFTPEVDGYTRKPIQRLLEGEVDLCIAPSEHLFFYGNDENRAIAVATILRADQSCFIVKKSAEIERPAQLSGETYIGYNTPLEEEVLKEMIRHDGGEAKFEMVTPGRLEVWEAFLQDQGQTAWVFSHWEAARAAYEGVDVQRFYPHDYGVPYGYSSVFMTRENLSKSKGEAIRTFLKLLAYATDELLAQPDSVVARKLCAHVAHPNFSNEAFIRVAWKDIKPAFLGPNQARWGEMKVEKWKDWYTWIQSQDSLPNAEMDRDVERFFTHIYLNHSKGIKPGSDPVD